MEIQVRKRDGNLEPWSYDKLVAAIGKAGIPVQEAEEIASSVQSWAQQSAVDGNIDSTQIRDKVIEALKSQFPSESRNFETYKKE
ncbi:hypothetical protein A2715_05840 [Candidatus Woesebacteria bacterium RIFCSPHIGHO2_01_FULL_39_32]|uniref:ATP-cone domain-containing protein n=2 Tax=Candidatus Woeseibacteriota TaxID=1752722 RepID=A0A1F8BN42_9BACT|nr:MAG: hypothetical protein A2124_00165 [Candidatus Woesebacteria bacterium GWB1_37_5]OGM25538.1 MAG: hypothetical protein A2715_05840 [Candidatus Woesebacteria bacterium RIFCSPHIGHO2_01_FULL_39_32]OGM36818.1 MAG: hypothetical protein A3F01_00315 [Candidatus Woesebacteria bacterium RIFCSPHIGHO2_12_FULL_38_11]OGM65069.1 MAG: hypothetical protein A2893_05450 [Candidatus Woesebacteria bacterium RIFCSPLOWO2_01_FULL_39_25]